MRWIRAAVVAAVVAVGGCTDGVGLAPDMQQMNDEEGQMTCIRMDAGGVVAVR